MPIYAESKTRFWGEGSNTILKWATGGDDGVFFERIFGCENRDVPEDWLERKSDSYRLCNMSCEVLKERDGSISLFMNTIRTIPVGAFEKIARQFPELHADGIFIQQTEEFFGSYIIENGHFLWTQFHNPGKRSGQEDFRFEEFFNDDISSVTDEEQRAVLEVLSLERRILRGDSSAKSKMKKLLSEFKDEKKQNTGFGFYFSTLEKKALCGDKDAQFSLYKTIDSHEYYEDKHIYFIKDDTECEVFNQDWDLMKNSWLHKAAMNGNPDAQFEMASFCYYHEELSEAKEWFRSAIENNCKEALEDGIFYFDVASFIDEELLAFLEDHAEKTSSDLLMRSLADYYKEVANPQKEEYWRKRLFDAGDLYDLEEFASFYYRNYNETKAINLYEQAIEKGSVGAMIELAKIYSSKGGKAELEKELILYEQAGENGSGAAYYELARIYALGKGVEKDIEKAFDYLVKAHLADNDESAESYLWLCIESGLMGAGKTGIKKSDLLNVVEDNWDFLEFIAQGFNGEDEMACALGIQQDEKKYVHWLEEAVKQGSDSSAYSLGVIYYEGKLVKQDYKSAFELLLKHASDSCNFEELKEFSQYYLGLMYQNGNYIPQNLFMAKKWFEISAEAGDEKSIEALKDVKAQIKGKKLKPDMMAMSEAETFEEVVYNMYEEMYRRATEGLKKLGAYNDAPQRLQLCLKKLKLSVSTWNKQNEETYDIAIRAFENEDYAEASDLFATILGWKDSAEKHKQALELVNDAIYEEALNLIEEGNLGEAKEKLESISEWRDSKVILKDLPKFSYEKLINNAQVFIEKRKYKKALDKLLLARDNDYEEKDIESIEKDISYCNAFIAFDKKEFKKAQELFSSLGDWRDSEEQLAEAIEIGCEWRYNQALYYMDNKEYGKAKELLLEITNWKDSQDLIVLCDSKM